MKKLPIILAASLFASSLGGVPVYAMSDQMSVVANEVVEPALVFTMTNTRENRIDFTFDGTERKIKLKRLIIASYIYAEFAQRMVEERLFELGPIEWPAWAHFARDFTPELSKNDSYVQSGPIHIDDYSNFFGNYPGLFYYAAQIQNDEEEAYWVRGKIDYRMCAYQSNVSSPHNKATCYGRIDESTQKYVFERSAGMVRDPNDTYVSWGEEWGSILLRQLQNVDSDVRYWFGDAARKEQALGVLRKVRNTAEDASNEAELLARVDEYEAILNAKTYKMAVNELIAQVEQEVEAWDGDEEERARISGELKRLEDDIAEVTRTREFLKSLDALTEYLDEDTNVDWLASRVTRCAEKFEEKTTAYDLAHSKQEEEEKPKEEEPKQDEEEPGDGEDESGKGESGEGEKDSEQEGESGEGGSEKGEEKPEQEGGKTPASSTSNGGVGSGLGGVVTPGYTSDDSNNAADKEATKNEDVADVIPSAPDLSLGTQAPVDVVVAANTEAASDDLAMATPGDEVTNVGAIVGNDMLDNNTSVPALSNDGRTAKRNNGGFWVAVACIVSAVAAGLWWLKRAFGRNRQ